MTICKSCTRVATKNGYCDRCKSIKTIRPPYNPRKNKPGKRKTPYALDNDAQMRALAKEYMYRHPFCCRCRLSGKRIPAKHLDHIIPVRVADHLKYEESNWQPLCVSCHSRKTQAEIHEGIAYDYLRKKKYDLTKGGQ